MKKNFIFVFMLLVSVLFITNVKAENLRGKVSTVGSNVGTVSPDGCDADVVDITFSNVDLKWAPADESIGRYKSGWWLGVKFEAPSEGDGYQKDKATFTRNTTTKNFSEANDNKAGSGNDYFYAWIPLDDETKEADANVTVATYTFDWDGNGTNDQTFNIKLATPSEIKLENTSEKGEEMVRVTIADTDTVFTLLKNKALNDLSTEEKAAFNKLLTPPAGKVLDAIYNEKNEVVTMATTFDNDTTLTIKFKNAPSKAPEAGTPEDTGSSTDASNTGSTEAKKDEANPNTSDKMVFYMSLVVVSVAICAISTKTLLKRLY